MEIKELIKLPLKQVVTNLNELVKKGEITVEQQEKAILDYTRANYKLKIAHPANHQTKLDFS